MNIRSVDFFSENAPVEFTKSLKETGFAVLKTHPINWDLIQTVYTEWEAFLKSDDVNKYQFNSKSQDGYFPKNVSEIAKGEKIKDIKHFFHLYFPWGKYPTEVSNAAREMFEQMMKLGETLLQWIDDNIDPELAKTLPQKLIDTVSKENTLLRILHYPAMNGDEEAGAVRAAAHEDINLITLLPIASEAGLQVLSPATNEWYDVPCDSESIIVNIGDMLQEMTNKEYIATKHRVIKPEGEDASKDRMSTPCFIHPKDNVYLSEKYPKASIFLKERLKELGLIK